MQDVYLAMHITAGLPMRSLQGQSWSRKGATIQLSGIIETGSHDWLPYVPIWPGFTVNTLFYAAILWLLIPGPFALRRFIRRLIRQRRGHCPTCGYDRRHGEHEACPECGVTA